MSTRQISFAIQGMFCAKCAASIERALAAFDGVAVARVNYAAERANIVYAPARVTTGALVRAVRGEGFDVLIERTLFYSDDLLYATSARAVERALARVEGIVQVSANLAARRIAIEIIPEATTRDNLTRALARLGFRAAESPSSDAEIEFVARGFGVAVLGIILIWGAVNHDPVLSAGLLPSPILLGSVDAVVIFGAGFPFFRRALLASAHGEVDLGVLLAFITLVAFICGAVFAVTANAQPERVWSAWSGFIVATALTTSWFAARGWTTIVLPRLVARRPTPAPTSSLGVISHGTRH